MKKNVASQKVGAQMVSASDGSAFTGSVTVFVTLDAGTQAQGTVGSGACTHEGNGYHTYAPSQAETNGDHAAFTFTGTGAVPATVQVYTSFPQTGDGYAVVNDGTHGNAAIKGYVDDIGTAGAGLTAIPWNAAWDAEVQSEVADALAVYDPPTNAEMEARTLVAANYFDPASDSVIVGTNNDKTGYGLSSSERNSTADAILDRDMSTGTDSGSTTVRTVRQALRFLRNKWAIVAGTLTVYKENDSTASWTAAVTTDAAAEPITSNDPAGP